MSRVVRHRYRDPLDEVWEGCARRVGLRVERADEAFASTDGAGGLILGPVEALDADDCLAQMVLHELCHSLVEGRSSFREPDWGLANADDRDAVREHACLRLQAVLAARHGLRGVLAPTTEHRAFWDALDADPLADREEESVRLAIAGLQRAGEAPWAPHLERALEATASILTAARDVACPDEDGDPSLGALLEPAPGPHQTGLPASAERHPERTCGTCAWSWAEVPGGVVRCRQAGDARTTVQAPGCERWEPALDCRTCAACCREGFDLVPVEEDEPLRSARPELLEPAGDLVTIRRTGGRCAALAGEVGDAMACTIYAQRPIACSQLEVGGEHCLAARRRCSLSI